MQTENTKQPLYKVLNQQRTQGEWFSEYDNDEFGQFYSLFNNVGENVLRYNYGTVKDEEYKANAQYAVLAANNLAPIAEALEQLVKWCTLNTPDFPEELVKAKRALSAIS